ncbi:hypothetical protein Tco_0628604 [Tanacetum coccineum]|uniref:Reverse transcriptase domain-containing protein n=1 Tax=Tanacetum coccineum TaxID=301880 RepID=A0ABQ4WQW0_9ASTR
MSYPNRSTSDIKDAFSSMNILNLFSSFYNNPYLKDVQAIYAKELPISSPDPITSPAILTPSPILPPSLLFDPRYFFVLEKLLPPKKQIHSPSSSSTTLSNSSRNQTCDLVSPSSSVYTPTPPQIFEIGKCPIKMYLKHHEGQIEDILNYLDELYLHHIEKMEEGRIDRMIIRRNSNELKTQIIRLQKKRLGQKDKIACGGKRQHPTHQSIFGCHSATDCDLTTAQEARLLPWQAAKGSSRPYSLGLIEPESVFSQRDVAEENKSNNLLLLKRLLTNKYCPRTEIKKMEDEFYGLTVNGSDLKTYIRRFQELAVLCPNMVPNTENTYGALSGGWDCRKALKETLMLQNLSSG